MMNHRSFGIFLIPELVYLEVLSFFNKSFKNATEWPWEDDNSTYILCLIHDYYLIIYLTCEDFSGKCFIVAAVYLMLLHLAIILIFCHRNYFIQFNVKLYYTFKEFIKVYHEVVAYIPFIDPRSIKMLLANPDDNNDTMTA